MVAMPKSDRATNAPTRRVVERTSLPAWVKPQLAALVKKAPDGLDWLHEIKLDGYRMHARLDAGRVKILTRRGNDWTQKYPGIAEAIAVLPAQNAYLDGELWVLPDGKTAFNLIQNATDAGAAANDCRQRLHLPIVGMIIDIEAGDPGRLSRPQIALPAADPHKAEIVELDIAVMAFADVPE